MSHDLEKYLPGFVASEQHRRHVQFRNFAVKLGASNPAVGAAADEPEIEITSITAGHTAGATMQTISVPVGANDGGETLYVDHKLWPDVNPTLAGDAKWKALISVVEELSRQGSLADCYALSALNTCILSNFSKLTERIVSINGKITVYGFYLGDPAHPLTFTMDYNLGNVGVSIGPAGCIAYKAFEKLWAFARYLKLQADGVTVTNMYDPDYNRENSGWMSEVFRLLFGDACYKQLSPSPTQTFLNVIQTNLDAGFAVSIGTTATGGNGWVADHAYATTQEPVTPKPAPQAINPWGVNFPPMLRDLTDADTNCFFHYVVVADLSKAYPVPHAIPGDANGDGVADFADFVVLSNHYGQATSNGAADGDFNGDGVVNFADFVILSNNFNPRAGALPANFPPKETIMPTAKITGTDHDGGAHSWDNVRVTFATTGGTPTVTVAPPPPKPPAIDASGASASFPMPNADATITLTVTAPDGTKATDTRVVKLSAPAPMPTPPAPTTTKKPKVIVYDDFTTGPYVPNL